MLSKEASRIISTAIHRLASSVVSEVTLCTVALPNDELKGELSVEKSKHSGFRKGLRVKSHHEMTPSSSCHFEF